ncbi:uncharacterized protein TNCT_535421 [Trichonephila clavata]|uniref:Uncharacterized protein n=1 Tax=Trichonephila clavata TaxID=2740835 RepID=A0A8X6IU43_TRICU|nr:uncharacterized protein TNCT_535421 [Trichonephila clavata]
MLKLYRQRLRKCRSVKEIKYSFRQTINLLCVIKKMEESLSTCIFFVVAFNLILSFNSLSYGLGYYSTKVSITVAVMFRLLSNQMSFIFICSTASDVINEIRNLKTAFHIALCSLKQNELILSTLFQKLVVFDSVSLTGWKMFNLSKKLILSALGSILAYGLLVLQTSNSENPIDSQEKRI